MKSLAHYVHDEHDSHDLSDDNDRGAVVDHYDLFVCEYGYICCLDDLIY